MLDVKEPVRKSRTVAAGALGLVSRGMALGSLITRAVADRLRGDRLRGDGDGRIVAPIGEELAPRPARGDEGPGPVRLAEARLHPPAEEEMQAGAVLQPPTEPVPEVETHARTHETHLEELTDLNASELVRRIRDLSTDELRRLWEHESANKKRKTVLQAIEAQAAPDHA